MTVKPFDPLESGATPETRGYGKRVLRLSADLKHIEIVKVPQQVLVNAERSANGSQIAGGSMRAMVE